MFSAPAYLPAFAKEAGLPEEKTTSKYWFNYLMGQVKSYKTDPPESTNEKKIIKQRIKALGTFLCDAVLNDHNLDCSDYLGKNRNVLAFPERYFQAIFPFHEKISENLLSVADTWYHTLLKTLLPDFPGHFLSFYLTCGARTKNSPGCRYRRSLLLRII